MSVKVNDMSVNSSSILSSGKSLFTFRQPPSPSFSIVTRLKSFFKASENCEAFIRLFESTNTEVDISTHLKDRIVLVPSPLVLKMKQPGT